ncbi:hypothetical protein D3227_40010 [Mesorhizobium waimense]|uniref:Uncharacterized protein n=1 Tax=Mesorhizobium waimense TaxID=1300307 RepID=A0A3A5JMT0_9HYPH|nr:hypothetical protein D3227_40010 [Mesorhizobium waimense]
MGVPRIENLPEFPHQGSILGKRSGQKGGDAQVLAFKSTACIARQLFAPPDQRFACAQQLEWRFGPNP